VNISLILGAFKSKGITILMICYYFSTNYFFEILFKRDPD